VRGGWTGRAGISGWFRGVIGERRGERRAGWDQGRSFMVYIFLDRGLLGQDLKDLILSPRVFAGVHSGGCQVEVARVLGKTLTPLHADRCQVEAADRNEAHARHRQAQQRGNN